MFEDLPEATLAAVVIAAVVELVDIDALQELRRAYTPRLREIYGAAARPDLIAALAAMFGVLIFDTLPGLFIGVVVSLLLLVYRASRPHVAMLGRVAGTDKFVDVERYDDVQPVPGVVVLRPETGLFFANADAVRDRIRAELIDSGAKALVLDAETVPSIDLTAIRMLDDLAADLEREGVQLAIARDVGQVRDLLAEAAHADALRRVYPTVPGRGRRPGAAGYVTESRRAVDHVLSFVQDTRLRL